MNNVFSAPQYLFLDTKELAKLLKISANTLAKWRLLGKGPKFHHVGRRIIYYWLEVLAWLGLDIQVFPTDLAGMDAISKALTAATKRKSSQ
jgi:hypothetical protein